MTVAKTGTVSPRSDQDAAQVGDTIAYSYLVTNTGNVTLTSLAVHDPTGGPVTCPTPAAPGLPPARRRPALPNTPYTVTQADVDNGNVIDTATATGIDTAGQRSPSSNPSTAIIDTTGRSAGGQHQQNGNGDTRRRSKGGRRWATPSSTPTWSPTPAT